MSQEPAAVKLTAQERDVIAGLRALGESPLSRRVLAVVDGLIRIGGEPCCLRAQADGVPCASVHCQCDACDGVFERVEALVEENFPSRAADRAQKI